MQKRLIAFLPLFFCIGLRAQTFQMFVGTYTGTGSKGIYVYQFDAATGKATLRSNTDSVVNPSYLAIAPNKKFIYAVNETHGSDAGKVSAFAFNVATGKLTLINQQFSGGDDPCYVSVNSSNNWIAVANYSGGSLSVLPVSAAGGLEPYVQLIQDVGNGPNTGRQEKAHVHAAVFSPDFSRLYTPDLGTDKLMAYHFLPGARRPISPAKPPFIKAAAGSGPRHLTFSPNNKFAYLVQELMGTVAVYSYANGNMLPLQTIATHPNNYLGARGSADIHVSPDGKFLYASNRGDANTIAIFSINRITGKLTTVGYQLTMGKTPRNFAIDPTGNFLLVANQETDNIVIFKRNMATGLLTATSEQIKVPKPVCIKLM